MSLIEVKNKIKSTKNTKKTTKAMQLVAASKMKRFQLTAVHARDYALSLMRHFRLMGAAIQDTPHGQSKGEKTLFVLLTSDKGLCGAMNTRLQKQLAKSEAWTSLTDDKRDLITVGRKSTEAMKYAGVEVRDSFTQVVEEMTPMDAMPIISAIMEAWETGEYKEIRLISPWYVNAFLFHTLEKVMLPLTDEAIVEYLNVPEGEDNEELAKIGDTTIYEPDQERVAEVLAKQIVEARFIEAFYQLKATEYSSRMVAMKKATEAADDQIKILTGQYNRARQAAITQQLSELAAASEAMSTQNSYEIFD